ncbi:MAG: phospho-N-acetylmuramoyl-pentapeptide-transferase [Limnochordia bacterium]|jgi:phospho-N-acetylmuramoyl-pentapeptide-transferase|nr:MAG: phospho-N-acetylmuramoyl-pentapeptide-transferase [Peptococcaceae bacterium 1109]
MLQISSPMLAALIAFGLAVLAGPGTIYYLRRLKFGQQVRSDGPKTHLKKAGTPSMGGVLILLALAVAVVLTSSMGRDVSIALLATLGYGVIGLLDDGLKIIAKRSLGLRARDKLVGQIGIALLISLFALSQDGLNTSLIVPFVKTSIELHPVVFVIFNILVMVAASNAVNITDGLDGLAAGTTATAALAFAILAWLSGSHDLAVFFAAVAGACLGFAWFNAHPAQVFMGDTGSLGLGAALAAGAILTGTTLFLPIIGGLFVVETLSVIIQVAYFRLTKGKRVFRMAPLHHHFELGGWSETTVMIRFWLLGLVCAAVGLLGAL